MSNDIEKLIEALKRKREAAKMTARKKAHDAAKRARRRRQQ